MADKKWESRGAERKREEKVIGAPGAMGLGDGMEVGECW
jgi:hypothetical protein